MNFIRNQYQEYLKLQSLFYVIKSYSMIKNTKTTLINYKQKALNLDVQKSVYQNRALKLINKLKIL